MAAFGPPPGQPPAPSKKRRTFVRPLGSTSTLISGNYARRGARCRASQGMPRCLRNPAEFPAYRDGHAATGDLPDLRPAPNPNLLRRHAADAEPLAPRECLTFSELSRTSASG